MTGSSLSATSSEAQGMSAPHVGTVYVPETNTDVSYEFAYLYENLPFSMPVVTRPSIPDRRVSLIDFGGTGDGVTLNTAAFARAIDALSKQGGGHLDVPAGIWLTGPITLKSNIDLHLDKNAVILFSSDKTLYPIIETSFEGLDTRRCTSPINAYREKNISITGEGVIDGSGDAWRPLKKSKVTSSQWKEKVASGGVLNDKGNTWYPSEDYVLGERQGLPPSRDGKHPRVRERPPRGPHIPEFSGMEHTSPDVHQRYRQRYRRAQPCLLPER